MDRSKISIMCVDDEEPNLFLFKVLFERNYRVLTANSGAEGLKILEDEGSEVAVVFSDMRMPSMDGLEFIRRASERFSHIVYFILSGYNSDDEVQKAVEQKLIRRFFTKPFDIDEIENCIEHVLMEDKVIG